MLGRSIPLASYVTSWLLSNVREELSNIFLQYAAGIAVIGTGFAVYRLITTGSGDFYMIATLFAAGAVHAGIDAVKRYGFMGHVSFAHFFVGYILVLYNYNIHDAHLFLLPMGAYLIALGYYLEHMGKSRRVVRVLHLVGFVTLALSAFIPSLSEHGGGNAIVLMTESIAAIGLGIWQRRTVFLGAGLTFMALDGVVRLWSPAQSLHWSIYAILVGGLVIVAGILIETRRELLAEKGAAAMRELKNWK